MDKTGEVVSMAGRETHGRTEHRVIYRIPREQIRVYAEQPRTHKAKEALRGLALSIKEVGQLTPAIVRRLAEPEGNLRYELIAGERRYLACGIGEIPTLECVIYDNISPGDQFKIAMIENFHRVQLEPLDEANGLKRLKEENNLTNAALAAVVGLSEATVIHRMDLLDLDPRVQAMLSPDIPKRKRLALVAAEALITLPKDEQYAEAFRTVSEGTTIRELRDRIRTKMHHGIRSHTARERQPRHDFNWVNGFLERAARDAELIANIPEDILSKAYEFRDERERLQSVRHAAELMINLGKITKKMKVIFGIMPVLHKHASKSAKRKVFRHVRRKAAKKKKV